LPMPSPAMTAMCLVWDMVTPWVCWDCQPCC